MTYGLISRKLVLGALGIVLSAQLEMSAALADGVRITAANSAQIHRVDGLSRFGLQAACRVKGRKSVPGAIRGKRFYTLSAIKRRRSQRRAFGQAAVKLRRTCAAMKPAPQAPQPAPQPPQPAPQPPQQPAPPSAGSIPNLAKWESQMRSFGLTHCNTLKNASIPQSSKLNNTYYDAEWVYYQIADYTGDTSWLGCAQAAESVYRNNYVLASNGAIPGYWVFSHGITQDYLRTGDQSSKDAQIALSQKAAYAPDATPLAWTVDDTFSREVAYHIMSFINAEHVGAPPRAKLSSFVEQAFGHMDQWFVSRSAAYIRPFMVALTSQALIEWHEKSGDARVIPKLTLAMDWIWDNMWLPGSRAFKYTNVETSGFPSSDPAYNTGGQEPAADLNLLIAPVYGWLYHQTGQARFRDRGDQIFAGGVDGAYLTNGKQFNQSYRWSFSYIKWRNQAPRR